MRSEEKLRGLGKDFPADRWPYPPGKALLDRVAQGLAEQPVAVAAGACIKTRMELRMNHPCLMNRHISG